MTVPQKPHSSSLKNNIKLFCFLSAGLCTFTEKHKKSQSKVSDVDEKKGKQIVSIDKFFFFVLLSFFSSSTHFTHFNIKVLWYGCSNYKISPILQVKKGGVEGYKKGLTTFASSLSYWHHKLPIYLNTYNMIRN